MRRDVHPGKRSEPDRPLSVPSCGKPRPFEARWSRARRRRPLNRESVDKWPARSHNPRVPTRAPQTAEASLQPGSTQVGKAWQSGPQSTAIVFSMEEERTKKERETEACASVSLCSLDFGFLGLAFSLLPFPFSF